MRHRQIALSFLTLAVALSGCFASREIVVQQGVQLKERERIYEARLVDSTSVSFESDLLGYALLGDTHITRLHRGGVVETIPLSSVRAVHVKKLNVSRTVIAIGLGLSSLGLVPWWILRSNELGW